MTQAPTERLSLRRRLEQERGRVWVVGHRGAMGHCPENTLASFERGLELGADWIELDVHLSRDGALVVIHDETVDRTTNGSGLVQEHTLAELKELDAGAWFGPAYAGQQILTLDEVLVWARSQGTVLDIEIKNAPVYYAGIEENVVQTLDRHGMTDQAIVISFDHRAVRRVRALDSRIVTGVLYACRPVDALSLARQAGADALLPHWAYVTSEDVRAAHAVGLSVAPWTSSDPEVLRGLIAAQVDGIGTNHPDVLRGIMAERGGDGGGSTRGGHQPKRSGKVASLTVAGDRLDAGGNSTSGDHLIASEKERGGGKLGSTSSASEGPGRAVTSSEVRRSTTSGTERGARKGESASESYR
jgi:glycerophosphoryl diester phosphodiesterase